jgi:hypothetical protein
MPQVELTGPLAAVRFPNVCASCGGAPPAGDVPLDKMFRRTYHESPTTYVFGRLQLPLCVACLAAHERATQPIDPAVLRRLRRGWALKVLPYIVPMGISLWLLAHLMPAVVKSTFIVLRDPKQWGDLMMVGVALFFGLCLFGFARMSINAGRPLIADGGGYPNDTHVVTMSGALGSLYVVPTPPTPPLAAVDFGDEHVELLAPNHRTFTFANADVAARFAEVNQVLLWDPGSPQALRAAGRQKVLVVAIAVAVLGVVAWQLLAPR